jgi:hypothetical protein
VPRGDQDQNQSRLSVCCRGAEEVQYELKLYRTAG